MKILLATAGTWGDIKPFTLIAEALTERGYDVILLLNPEAAKSMKHANYSIQYTRKPYNVKAALKKMNDASIVAKGFIFMNLYIGNILPSYMKTKEIIEKYHPDIILFYPICPGAHWAARKYKIMNSRVALQPSILLSTKNPSHLLLKIKSTWLRRLSILIYKHFLLLMPNYHLKKLIFKLNLPWQEHDIYSSLNKHTDMTLALWPEWFRGTEKDDPKKTLFTGFPYEKKYSHHHLSTACKNFLNQYPSPIIVGFGTSARHSANNIYQNIITSCQQLKHACILVGYNNQTIKSDHILTTPSEPFQLLFPYAAIIIHHGGIGTTAEALRSGSPSIIIPFYMDQFDNAARYEDLGAGLYLSKKNAKPKQIIAHIQRAKSDQILLRRAREISTLITKEELGQDIAARNIEILLKQSLKKRQE